MNQAPTFSASTIGTVTIPLGEPPSQFLTGYNNPSFSPDGNKIVFVSFATNLVSGDTTADADVFIMDLETGAITAVSTDSDGSHDYGHAIDPIFSPDGTKVAFATKSGFDDSETTANYDVYVKDLITGETTIVSDLRAGGASTDPNAVSRRPAWSADGTRIVFESDATIIPGDDNIASDIYITDLATGSTTRHSTPGAQGLDAIDPMFSLDGTSIVYSRQVVRGSSWSYDLFIEKIGSTGNLTSYNTKGPYEFEGDSGKPVDYHDLNPVYGPDGVLYFLSESPYDITQNNAQVTYKIVNGQAVATDLPINVSFSPDGTFAAGDGGRVIELATGATTIFQFGRNFDFSPNSDMVVYETFDSIKVSMLGSGDGKWTEGEAPTAIVSFANVADTDSGNFAGGTLSAAITANAIAGDMLSLSSNRVSVTGDIVSVDGIAVGTLSGTATSLSVALNANADDEAVEALTEAFRFSSSSDNPTAATRTVTFTLVDGGGTADGGSDTTSFTRNIIVVPVDDRPVVSFSGSADERAEVGTVVGTAQVTDPDGPGGYTFALSNDSNGDFAIDPNTGVVTVADSNIDFESDPMREIVIVVTDSSGAKSASTLFNVAVKDQPEVIYGTSAADTIDVPDGTEGFTVFGMQGDDVLTGAEGNDRLNGARDNDELRGAGGNDLLEGGTGNDFLDGGAGVDTLDGGMGDDSYVVDNASDAIIEREGEGTDSVRSSVSFALHANVEILTLTGTGNTNATGNVLDNMLTGNSGKNQLNGGGGADMMYGRGGDDTYYVNNFGDKAFEKEDEGIDTVFASVTYSIAGQYIEKLTLTGDALNATGNGLDNVITGNAQDNRIRGGLGADTMTGGMGDDTYFVDDLKDKVIELEGQGYDHVDSSVGFSLAGLYVERLTLSGNAAIDGTGNSFANILTGNNAANTLNGGAGADEMKGMGGDDRYIVDNAGDKVSETATGGRDTVESSVSFSLAGQYIEVLRLTGSAAIDGTGNNQANNLYGNAAANTLSAAGGDDKLFGGAGSDMLTGGTGADRFVFDTPLNAATNVDKILDFTVADDTIELDRSIFTGIAGGTLGASAFVTGTAAADANDRIVYDSATGNIWYDADGSGAGAAMMFANVSAGTMLTNADFFGV